MTNLQAICTSLQRYSSYHNKMEGVKEFEVLDVVPFYDYEPDKGLVKKYKIKVKILGKYIDWITVTDQEFMTQAYLDKIRELVEAYKKLLNYS